MEAEVNAILSTPAPKKEEVKKEDGCCKDGVCTDKPADADTPAAETPAADSEMKDEQEAAKTPAEGQWASGSRTQKNPRSRAE